MKNILVLAMILLSMVSFGQVTITCLQSEIIRDIQNSQNTSLFTGLKVVDGNKIIYLHTPVVYNNGNQITIVDAYKKSYTTTVTRIKTHNTVSKFYEFVTGCTPTGGSVSPDSVSTVVGLQDSLNTKQRTLVSGVNLKTINGSSLLGSTDLVISTTDNTKLSINNNLSDLQNNGQALINLGLNNVNNTSDAFKPVSIAMQDSLNLKQNTLVSGTNIKTVNGTSILGSGDIVIPAGATGPTGPQGPAGATPSLRLETNNSFNTVGLNEYKVFKKNPAVTYGLDLNMNVAMLDYTYGSSMLGSVYSQTDTTITVYTESVLSNVGNSSTWIVFVSGPRGATGATGAAGPVWRTGAGVPSNGLGVNGDFYYDYLTADQYVKSAGFYGYLNNIKGATGAQGPAGTMPNLTGPVTSVGSATSIANGAITNAMLANSAVANLSGINTGDQDLSGKQNTLISGTNIKTVNGTSLVGSGNVAAIPTGGTAGQVLSKIDGTDYNVQWAAGGGGGGGRTLTTGIYVTINDPNTPVAMHSFSALANKRYKITSVFGWAQAAGTNSRAVYYYGPTSSNFTGVVEFGVTHNSESRAIGTISNGGAIGSGSNHTQTAATFTRIDGVVTTGASAGTVTLSVNSSVSTATITPGYILVEEF